MSEQILEILLRTETRVIKIQEDQEKLYNDIIGILKLIHGIQQEILANLTAEQGGDLVGALRRLTEAVNALGSAVAASPNEIVSKIRTELKNKN